LRFMNNKEQNKIFSFFIRGNMVSLSGLMFYRGINRSLAVCSARRF